MDTSIKISSIIIAKNEANNIKRCIESQLKCIDEIIVIVDDTTSDNTEEILQTFSNVKYELKKWEGYSATKQYAVKKASNNWIFWIDADEEITKELSNELLKFKEVPHKHFVYSVARRAFFLGKWIKHCGWYPGRVERLFNRNNAYFSNSSVHEHLVYNGKAGKLLYDINHYTDPDINHYYEKFNKYTSLAASELHRQGKRASIKDLLIRPTFSFFKMYFMRLGFLDGLHGFILSIFSASYVFTKYSKLWELNKK